MVMSSTSKKKEIPFYQKEIQPRLESFFITVFSTILYKKGIYGEYSDELFSLQDRFGVDVPVCRNLDVTNYLQHISKKIVTLLTRNVLKGCVLHISVSQCRRTFITERYVVSIEDNWDYNSIEKSGRKSNIIYYMEEAIKNSLKELQDCEEIRKVMFPHYTRWSISVGIKEEFMQMCPYSDGPFAYDPDRDHFPWKPRTLKVGTSPTSSDSSSDDSATESETDTSPTKEDTTGSPSKSNLPDYDNEQQEPPSTCTEITSNSTNNVTEEESAEITIIEEVSTDIEYAEEEESTEMEYAEEEESTEMPYAEEEEECSEITPSEEESTEIAHTEEEKSIEVPMAEEEESTEVTHTDDEKSTEVTQEEEEMCSTNNDSDFVYETIEELDPIITPITTLCLFKKLALQLYGIEYPFDKYVQEGITTAQ